MEVTVGESGIVSIGGIAKAWVGKDSGELQAVATEMTMMNNAMDLIVDLIFTPYSTYKTLSTYFSANSAGCPPVCQNNTVSSFLKNPLRMRSIIPAAARPV
jgi:hypothetical protein